MTFGALAVWAALLVVSILQIVFVGTPYPVLTVALLALFLAFWVTSEARWRSLLQFVWGREKSARWGDTPWTPRYSLFLLVHAAIWLGLAAVFFLFANIRLVAL
jgi:hypothetical protein